MKKLKDLTGKFVVATDKVQSEQMKKTAVIIIRDTRDGTLGLVVNRELSMTMGDLLHTSLMESGGTDEQFDEMINRQIIGLDWDSHIAWGGPVEEHKLFHLFVSRVKPEEKKTRKTRSAKQNEVSLGKNFMALGSIEWAPGNLNQEIKKGEWLVVNADPATILSNDVDERYERVLSYAGIDSPLQAALVSRSQIGHA